MSLTELPDDLKTLLQTESTSQATLHFKPVLPFPVQVVFQFPVQLILYLILHLPVLPLPVWIILQIPVQLILRHRLLSTD